MFCLLRLFEGNIAGWIIANDFSYLVIRVEGLIWGETDTMHSILKKLKELGLRQDELVGRHSLGHGYWLLVERGRFERPEPSGAIGLRLDHP